MERSFNGVWIPRELYLHEDLSWSEKILMVEITSLANNNECFATNEYFAKFLGLSKDRISKMITKLHRMGLVDVLLVYKKGSKELEKRILTPIPIDNNTCTPRQKNLEGVGKNTEGGLGENTERGIGKNAYDNNSLINNSSFNNSINNSINNKKINKKEKHQEEFESLWKMYPRKLGDKKRAFKAYTNAIKKGTATYESVKYGIEMYINYNEYHNVQEEYIKHGSTWFHQECWNNDFTCKPKVIKGNRQGFLGLLLNEMDYEAQRSNVIDYEESMTNEQTRSKTVSRDVEYTLPFGF